MSYRLAPLTCMIGLAAGTITGLLNGNLVVGGFSVPAIILYGVALYVWFEVGRRASRRGATSRALFATGAVSGALTGFCIPLGMFGTEALTNTLPHVGTPIIVLGITIETVGYICVFAALGAACCDIGAHRAS